MTIGYKCLNPRDVARIVTAMLRAGVDSTSSVANSYDLVDRYEKEPTKSLITTEESKYINSLYKTECGLLTRKVSPSRRAMNIEDSIQFSADNLKYYSDKLWPLGIVLYGVDKKLVNTEDFNALKRAMNTIQQSTCVVFQEIVLDDVLLPKSYVWFEEDGEDMPELGFVEGKQSIKLSSLVVGAAGHTAHVVNNLLRVMGVPMMSNRFDRDNYVIIHWSNVETGKERYLEKDPEDAWFSHIPYDFDSVTHAPANYMCSHCELGQLTVQPIQDKLWQRTLSMGHTTKLSESDVKLVNMLYGAKCSVN
ncbi:astacin-like metalloprotease toxin 3 [Bicyclus anynana]|uniref:Metalloendopeptidase n=1 Tax=Bicyclus anynana TaxID=110368 RepID=A0ABM3M532_BICAN|nr:astacin-like metalloprotease toxin 3 [Bicyclus anynana]